MTATAVAGLLAAGLGAGLVPAAHAEVSLCGANVADYKGTFVPNVASPAYPVLPFNGDGTVGGIGGTYTAGPGGMAYVNSPGGRVAYTVTTRARFCDSGPTDLTSVTSFTAVFKNSSVTQAVLYVKQ
ncbi:hypothetical protein [Kitasatospora cineracea]|uniref:hypothetical protein n=1 Tax=Kitasatospora cineracea TaxID=88074 RepID=UPI0037B66AB9